jgi:hypothetical protein
MVHPTPRLSKALETAIIFQTMTMGGNERVVSKKKGPRCKMRCTHETSLETTTEVADDPARVPRARGEKRPTTRNAYSQVLSDGRDSRRI